MKINIKDHDKKDISIIVYGGLKIKQLKIALDKLPDFSMKDKYLVFEGMVLREYETLRELGIQDSCTIHMCDNLLPFNLRKPENILVFIKIEDGKEIPAIITNNMAIKELLAIIQSSIGYHRDEKYLYFDGKLLNQGKTLIEQGIQHSSTIHLSYSLAQYPNQDKPPTMVIYIETCSGEKLPLTVFGHIQVKELRKFLKEIYNLDISKYYLKFNGKILAYENTLEEMGICNLSLLSLILML